MQIESRIKKLEEQLPKISNECECFRKNDLALLNQAYGDEYNEKDILPDDMPYEGICIKCKKQISPTVKANYDNLLKIYGSFPEVFNEERR